jgi:hypothetical protein
MRGGGSRAEVKGGNVARRRRERYARDRQRYNPRRTTDEEPWEGDDDEAGTSG